MLAAMVVVVVAVVLLLAAAAFVRNIFRAVANTAAVRRGCRTSCQRTAPLARKTHTLCGLRMRPRPHRKLRIYPARRASCGRPHPRPRIPLDVYLAHT